MKWVLVIGISLIGLASLSHDVNVTSSPIPHVPIIASCSQVKPMDFGGPNHPEPKSQDPQLTYTVTASAASNPLSFGADCKYPFIVTTLSSSSTTYLIIHPYYLSDIL